MRTHPYIDLMTARQQAYNRLAANRGVTIDIYTQPETRKLQQRAIFCRVGKIPDSD